VTVVDNRGVWSDESDIPLEVTLFDDFKKQLEAIYSFISMWTMDMDTDVVAQFLSKQQIPLGYFYQGEYYLWEKEFNQL